MKNKKEEKTKQKQMKKKKKEEENLVDSKYAIYFVIIINDSLRTMALVFFCFFIYLTTKLEIKICFGLKSMCPISSTKKSYHLGDNY